MEKHYADLKEKDRIMIRKDKGIELVLNVMAINPLRLKTNQRELVIKEGEYVRFRNIGIFNYGNRKLGNRAHVRLELLSNYRYYLI